MPFIDPQSRAEIEGGRSPRTPGERCYEEYLCMVRRWTKAPRWTTVDDIAQDHLRIADDTNRAIFLAFMVFFAKHVMPYEEKKCAENGDITGE